MPNSDGPPYYFRSNLVEDSLKEISEKQKDLKKKLKISFVGEPGLDMGGLTKEWFQVLFHFRVPIIYVDRTT